MIAYALATFARQVHFIEDPATVLERAVDVVATATRAPWVAAYTWSDDGMLLRSAAAGEAPYGAPDAIDPDDPTLVVLRAERIPLAGAPESALAGSLALPFVSGGTITGLFAVGGDTSLLPDDVREALAGVATATGLALQILKARSLGEELSRWRERAQWAERELAILQSVLDRAGAITGEASPT